MIEVLHPTTAHVSYRCFKCNAVVDGEKALWLMDDAALGYPFCSEWCVSGPWPLSEVPGPDYSTELTIWSREAMIITWPS